jgi:hypothetical protein
MGKWLMRSCLQLLCSSLTELHTCFAPGIRVQGERPWKGKAATPTWT